MLEQKLAEAKANKRKRFIKITISIISIALIGVAVLLSTIVFDFNIKQTGADLVNHIDNTNQVIEQDEQTAVNTIPDEQLRQSYIDLLADYENNIDPELSKIELNKFDKSRADKLTSLKEEALSKFSQAEYSDAYNSLSKAKQFAEAIIADSQKLFKEAYANAQQAYDVDDHDNAVKYINDALMLNNQSDEAIDLKNKIDTLSEILPLIESANTAKVENNHEKELGLLEDIIKLAPDRESDVARKKELIDIIANNNFKRAITRSYNAIEKGDAVVARKNLNKAKKIFPVKAEIEKLLSAINKLEKKQRFEKHKHTAQIAMSDDNWQKAKQQLQLALNEHQGDAAIQELLLKVNSIITLNTQIEQLIAKPYSLTNSVVKSKANEKIAQAKRYINDSSSLKIRSDELSRLNEKMNNKVSVQVISDNQTNVLVRGVGIVGQTQSKVIELLPGEYKFEGKREGFKSKLLHVLIPYNKPDFNITVICDEPI